MYLKMYKILLWSGFCCHTPLGGHSASQTTQLTLGSRVTAEVEEERVVRKGVARKGQKGRENN